MEYAPLPDEIKAQFEAARTQTADDHGRADGFVTRKPNYTRKKIGQSWEPTCDRGEPATVPCVVLDPFAGSGSTGVAAQRLLRKFVGIELGAGYCEMAERRITSDAPLLAEMLESPDDDGTGRQAPLFSDE